MQTTAEKTKTQVVPLEKKVAAGIAAFNEKRQELETMAASSRGLRVEDINNKKELEVVSVARKKLKAERIVIEKQGKELRDSVNIISKNISAKEKELIGIISPVEDELQAEEDRVNTERDTIRQEAERKENERIQAMVTKLIAVGCSFDGVRYSIGENSTMHSTLIMMDDAMFSRELNTCKAIAEKIEEDRKEQERLKMEQEEAERRRIADEKKRMEDERAELLKMRQEQEEKERKLTMEANRLKEEKEAQEKAETLRKEAAERELVAIQRAKESEEKRIVEIEIEKEKARKEEAEKIRIDSERIVKEQEQQRIETERQNSLRPDKEKFLAFSEMLSTIKMPDVVNEKSILLTGDLRVMLGKMQSHILTKIKTL
jgi:hypothetical protein